ncbi:MAG TPA: DUF4129 domain-containing protein [Caldimonas sp.]|nr:DUF4129 domain-containing protein [Caldimonas sp.]
MRSGTDGAIARIARALLAAASIAASFVAPAHAQSTSPPQAARERADVAAVEAAASAVRADTDLGGVHTTRTWRFKKQDSPERVSPDPFWLDLARWLSEGGRGLVWLLGAAAAVAAIVTARRWLAIHGDAIRAGGARLPSHVRELDIRPETLPADIGAAVRALWLAGERRAALSLLYRGTLSRLVHSYAVAIGDASTEGDCIRLARATLPAERGDFVARLVGAWQLAVYGDRPLANEHVLCLCDDFDRMLPALASATSASAQR